ncbi:hypothetical protein DRO91_02780 [Candidatus Heimdallarchaeota archaeon]|nr:MAG: hypothetical protein DRP02_03745 [Candidatus Gerdarchaeota archaeon]RLI73510.1 MAG: hypothetical protein DRO91_02780 [Candidatus Heimdallarchaeota archaeon]
MSSLVHQKEILCVEGITKIFGKKNSPQSIIALDAISFKMNAGANALLGPNGAGKSTLIKILLSYLKADQGEAQLLGHDIFKEGMLIRQKVGYMPEHFAIIPGVNAVKQVSLLGRISGLPKEEAMQRAHETLQYVGLNEARYRKVKEFSTGMLQRLKLAQTLVNDPELIILDEPTNGLDPNGRIDMIELVKEISKEHGINLIVSSHLLPDIEATCEFATIINKGAVVAQGKISELTYQETRSVEKKNMKVEIRGDLERFLAALQTKGIPFQLFENTILVQYSDEEISTVLLKLAYENDIQIRTMVPSEAILEDVFVHRIADMNNKNGLPTKETKIEVSK